MKNLKKIFTLVMVLAMVMTLAVPAMAADTYSITINNPSDVEHTYEVYQIFTGTLDAADAANEGNHILSDVKWGGGVDGAALFAELTQLADSDEKYPNFYTAYQTALSAGTANSGDDFESIGEAAQIAEVLGNNSNSSTIVSEFARAAGAHLSTTCVELTATGNGVYTATGFVPGYYLTKDEDGSLDDTKDTYTNYILQVVGNTNVNAKGGTVTVDKVIVDGSQDVEVADYSIGDTVVFNIYGTLPENYGKFTNFKYQVYDTMSAGLTYDAGSVKVSLENAGQAIELPATIQNGDETVTVYTVSTADGADGKTILTVNFSDLKNIPGRTVDDHTMIIVEYTATLNDKAVIGGNGNKNSVKIIFDNDPYSDGEGETPEDHVFAFTFELDVKKVNGQQTDATSGEFAPLAGAKFVLFRRIQGAAQYAVLDSNGRVIGWTPFKNQAEVDAYATENNLTDAQKNELAPATEIVSGVDGMGKIIGLESDLYHLEEIDAPAGFNILTDVIDIDIKAIVSEADKSGTPVTNGQGESAVVTHLTIKVDTGNIEDGNTSTGVVDMEVINNPGALLPETGGMGTTLFYIFGGLMVCAAVVLLITKKRMAV